MLAIVHGVYVGSLFYPDCNISLRYKPTLLIFVVRWCDHRKPLQPQVRALASFGRTSPEVLTARVGADKELDKAEKLKVRGFSPILFYLASDVVAARKANPRGVSDWRYAEVIENSDQRGYPSILSHVRYFSNGVRNIYRRVHNWGSHPEFHSVAMGSRKRIPLRTILRECMMAAEVRHGFDNLPR